MLFTSLARFSNVYFLFNPVIYLALKLKFKPENISTILLHDLPLANTVFHFFAMRQTDRTQRPKLVLDLHEVWPHALQDWHSNHKGTLKLFHRAAHKLSKWEKYECDAAYKFHHLIVVTGEMKIRLKEKYRISNNKISVNHKFQS